MSSRALRKLEQLKATPPNAVPEDASESEDEPPPAPKPSLFALLDIPDERDASDEEPEWEEEGGAEREPEPAPSKPATKKAKAKKKKKGKGKAKPKADDAKSGGGDEIDCALRQLDLVAPDTAPTVGRAEDEKSLASVLKVDSRNLDAENEIKRLFGRDALRPGGGAEEGEAPGRRRGAVGGRALNRGRRNTFVQPKDEWPNAGSGGLGMEIEGSDLAAGTTTYRFVHSPAYQGVQREFLICVASMGSSPFLAQSRVWPC